MRRSHQGELRYNGIDRVNGALGYVVGNVVTACAFCNRAKSDMPIEAFERWLDRVAAFTVSRRADLIATDAEIVE